MSLLCLYIKYIYDRYLALKNSGKEKFNNNDLCKIFEYYSAIKLSDGSSHIFYMYDDIDPVFKEDNMMTRSDSGIDLCNLIDCIVQCKLRENSLSWQNCATFFGSNLICNNGILEVKWKNMIITRNIDSKLSPNLSQKISLFRDVTYDKSELIAYCESLLLNPPVIPKAIKKKLKLRDYQVECINLIKNNSSNIVINLPTGTGKNVIIVNALEVGKKYLILVPRIFLLEQIHSTILKHSNDFVGKIQLLGDGNNVYDQSFDITIAVFNSVHLVSKFEHFNKIFIDEAHHIRMPEIYQNEELDETIDEVEEIEEIETKPNSYIELIQDLKALNNVVSLSATIDQEDGAIYYQKDIREMIEKKHLSDYLIKIPVFNSDPTNKNICEYLVQNYQNIIIYCNSQKEGNEVTLILNSLFNNSAEYIDCNTSRAKRNNAITRFKSGRTLFLVNVRVLTEGFDAPITKGVCMLHMPSSDKTTIQIMGRALRLHDEKTYAHIILPYSLDEDRNMVMQFMRCIARNDHKLKLSFENKKLGGYVDIIKVEENDCIDLVKNKEIELRFEMVYNSLGALQNGEEIWMKRYNELIGHLDKYEKKPHLKSKDVNEKKLAIWIRHQISNYKHNVSLMKYLHIKNLWEKLITHDVYKKHLLTEELLWKYNLMLTKEFIKTHKQLPPQKTSNHDIRLLSNWLNRQLQNYKNKTFIMQSDIIYNIWTDFITDIDYVKYFESKSQIWSDTLCEVKNIIKLIGHRPTTSDSDIKIKQLAIWICKQTQNYRLNANIMKQPEIREKWKNFINDPQYSCYFK